jgi:hypothetical protein
MYLKIPTGDVVKGTFQQHLIIMKVIVTLTFLANDRTATFLFEKGTIKYI